MERRYKTKPHKTNVSYWFSQWDICLKCKYIENDNRFRHTKKKVKKVKVARRKRKKPFKRPKYSIYIKSAKWKKRRERYWKEHGKDCKACGSTERPTVHHVHYGYLGREQDEHLIGLCWDCHQDFHLEYGVNTTMQDETLEFIEKKQFEMMNIT